MAIEENAIRRGKKRKLTPESEIKATEEESQVGNDGDQHLEEEAEENVEEEEADSDDGELDDGESSEPPAKQAMLTKTWTGQKLKDDLTSADDGVEVIIRMLTYIKKQVDQDLLKEYLDSGGTMLEFVKVLDKCEKKNLGSKVMVFSALQMLLFRILRSYENLHQPTIALCKQIIVTQTTPIHVFLSAQSAEKAHKVTLQLLTAMILLDDGLAIEILNHVKLLPSESHHLMSVSKPRNFKSVRNCFIQFFLAFLFTKNLNIFRVLIERKHWLAGICAGMIYEKREVIEMILGGLKSCIVENPKVYKTIKMKIFTTQILGSLIDVYNWKGPAGFYADQAGKKNGRVRFADGSVILEDKEIVNDLLHDFLTLLLTSTRHGLAFIDRKFATSNQNKTNNELIASVLKLLDRVWEHKKPKELVLNILKTCPDLIKMQQKLFEPFLEPRMSTKWIQLMTFIREIVSDFKIDQYLETISANSINTNVSFKALAGDKFARGILSSISPEKIIDLAIKPALNHENIIVRHQSILVLIEMTKKLTEIVNKVKEITENVKRKGENKKNTKKVVEFSRNVETNVQKRFQEIAPSVSDLMNVFQPISEEEKEEGEKKKKLKEEKENGEFSKEKPTDEVFLFDLLHLIQLYIKICPTLTENQEENAANVSKLLRFIDFKSLPDLSENFDSNLCEIKLKFIEVLINFNCDMSSTNNPVVYQILHFLFSIVNENNLYSDNFNILKQKFVVLLRKILGNMLVFKDCENQVDIWVNCLGFLEGAQQEVTRWLIKMIKKTMKAEKRDNENSSMICDITETEIDELKEEDVDEELPGSKSVTTDQKVNLDVSKKLLESAKDSIRVPKLLEHILSNENLNLNNNIIYYLSFVVPLSLHCQHNNDFLLELCQKVDGLLGWKYLNQFWDSKSKTNDQVSKNVHAIAEPIKKPFESKSVIRIFSKNLLKPEGVREMIEDGTIFGGKAAKAAEETSAATDKKRKSDVKIVESVSAESTTPSKVIKITFQSWSFQLAHKLNEFEIICLLRMVMFHLKEQIHHESEFSEAKVKGFELLIVTLLEIAADCGILNEAFDALLTNPVLYDTFTIKKPATKYRIQIVSVTSRILNHFRKKFELERVQMEVKTEEDGEMIMKGPKFDLYSIKLVQKLKEKLLEEMEQLSDTDVYWKATGASTLIDLIEIFEFNREKLTIIFMNLVKSSSFLIGKDKRLSAWGLLLPKLLNSVVIQQENSNLEDDTNESNDKIESKETATEEETSPKENLSQEKLIKIFLERYYQLKTTSIDDLGTFESSLIANFSKNLSLVKYFESKKLKILLNYQNNPETFALICFLVNNSKKVALRLQEIIIEDQQTYLTTLKTLLQLLDAGLQHCWSENLLKIVSDHLKPELIEYFKASSKIADVFDQHSAVVAVLIEKSFDESTAVEINQHLVNNPDKLEQVSGIHILLYFQVIQKLFSNDKEQKSAINHLKMFIQLLLRCCVSALKKANQTSEKMKLKILYHLLSTCVSIISNIDPEFSMPELQQNRYWHQFIRFSIKSGLKIDESNQKTATILQILVLILKISNNDAVPVADEESEISDNRKMFEMLISHSAFLKILSGDIETSKSVDSVTKIAEVDEKDSPLLNNASEIWIKAILTSEYQQRTQKEAILELISIMISKTPDLLLENQISLLLSIYKASLSFSDRKILEILCIAESQGLKITRPFIWGQPATHYQQQSSEDRVLTGYIRQRVTTGQVLDLLEEERVKKTFRLFPINRSLDPTQDYDQQYQHHHNKANFRFIQQQKSPISPADAVASQQQKLMIYQEFQQQKSTLNMFDTSQQEPVSDLYDPAFFLPVFTDLLADNSIVATRKFIISGALSLTIAALSSNDIQVRLAAISVLSRLHFHLEGARFRDKIFWLHFIELLKSAISEAIEDADDDLESKKDPVADDGEKMDEHQDNAREGHLNVRRISSLITVFLSKTVLICTQPLHPLYQPLTSFLLARPNFRITTIPEFLKLFHSSEVDHLIHRHFILKIIRDGLKTAQDFKLISHNLIFKMLFIFFESIVADKISKLFIVQIISQAIKTIPGVLAILLRDYSFLVFVQNLVTSNVYQHAHLILDILKSLMKYQRGNGKSQTIPFFVKHCLEKLKLQYYQSDNSNLGRKIQCFLNEIKTIKKHS